MWVGRHFGISFPIEKGFEKNEEGSQEMLCVRYLQPWKPHKQRTVSGMEQLHHGWGWAAEGYQWANLTTYGLGRGAALFGVGHHKLGLAHSAP